MKVRNSFLSVLLVCLSLAFAKAQRGVRVGYIDMEYILENVPEYQKAKQQLELKMSKWKMEIDEMKNDIEKANQELKNERVLLTEELIEEKEEEIKLKQEELALYQERRFGAQGDFILQKKQLIQPVQDQVFNEVRKVSKLRKYDFVVNSDEVTLLYADERHDMSDLILKAIGRTSKKGAAAKRSREEEAKELQKPYLSVEEAEIRNDKKEAKEAVIEAKLSERDERARKRDSARAAKREAQLEKRRRLLAERKRIKDSVANARAEARKKKD